MNKIMKWFLIIGLTFLVVGTIVGGLGYYQGGGMDGLKRAYPDGHIEFNF